MPAKTKVLPRKPGTAITPAKSTALVPTNWRKVGALALAESAAQTAKLPGEGGNAISFRGGVLTIGGIEQSSPCPVILLAHHYARTYYESEFQADQLTAPTCYSYDGIKPHEQAKEPQSDLCGKCRWQEWQSARNSRGKGCKEGARIALMSADAFESVEKAMGAQIYQGKISVLNSKAFKPYAKFFEESGTPMFSVLTQLHIAPNARTQYSLKFVAEEIVVEDEILDAIAARLSEATAILTAPYPDFEEQKPQTPKRKTRFSGK